MKSSPKSEDVANTTESKTPASAKKLVQARLPFKTLGGSEPPIDAATSIATASATTINNIAVTPTNARGNVSRKRKPPTTIDDSERAAKINRRSQSDDDILLVSSSEVEPDHDHIAVVNELNDGIQSAGCSDTVKTNEHTCNDDNSKSQTPRARRSLNIKDAQPEASNRSRRAANADHFQIKLPMPKKAKGALKKAKIPKKASDDMAMEVDDDEHDDKSEKSANNEEHEQSGNSSLSSSEAQDKPELSGNESKSTDELNESVVLDESFDSTQPSTPDNRKMTPKQLQRRAESEKKLLEKKLERDERERLKKLERDEKEEQRKREKEEKEQLKKKEREEKEEQRKREKEEERKKREEKEEQRKREKEDERRRKEEQKEEERRRKEEQKEEERRRKEEQKEEERRKKDEEKRLKSECEQNKLKKTSAAFVKFFVPKKSDMNDGDRSEKSEMDGYPFMSFQVKDDMKIAPLRRRELSIQARSNLDQLLSCDSDESKLYMAAMRSKAFVPGKSSRTWTDEDDEKSMNSDDLFIIDEGKSVQVIEEKPMKLYRAKFLKFKENRRPAYYGTWRKKSQKLGPRRPFVQDTKLFDYEVDSDDEWEEEEPGESLHGTDDESEREPEDDYDIDNDFFVPHGYLSDEEMQANEDDFDYDNDPENNKDKKLKLIQEKFNDDMKKPTHKLKPRLIGLIWLNVDGRKPDNCSNGVWDLFNANAMYVDRPSIKIEPAQTIDANSDEEPATKRCLRIGEKEVPDLIRLINGNQNNCNFLVREFQAHINKMQQGQREYSNKSIKEKIKELAFWQACPEQGPMFGKKCWYVSRDTCKRYGVNDVQLPNAWVYTIPPRKAAECEDKDKSAEPSKAPLDGVIEIDDDSNSCGPSGLTPQLVAQASSKPNNYNIAKFIRVLSEEEKKKQFHPITLRRESTEQIALADKQLPNNEPTSADDQPMNKPKKRAKLLMSVPIGQEISQKMKSTLVTQYLESNTRTKSAKPDDGNKNGNKPRSADADVILID